MAIWTELALKGHPTAQLNLGQIYRLGKGVEQDDAAAIKWYILAAQNGSKTAAANLMMMEQEGRATRAEVATAFQGELGTAAETVALENLQPPSPTQTQAQAPAAAQAPTQQRRPSPTATAKAPAPDTRGAAKNWIMTLPGEAFVIQILKSADADSLVNYAKARLTRVKPMAQIVPTKRGLKKENLLLLGPYKSQREANRALQALPNAVRQGMPWAGGQPWVRTAASIQRISA